jgi:hypothetical protein
MDVIHHGEEAYATGEGAILIRDSTPAERDVAVAEPA